MKSNLKPQALPARIAATIVFAALSIASTGQSQAQARPSAASNPIACALLGGCDDNSNASEGGLPFTGSNPIAAPGSGSPNTGQIDCGQSADGNCSVVDSDGLPSGYTPPPADSGQSGGDLPCEAVLCLSTGSPPSECMPSLSAYFGITGKNFIERRAAFLASCQLESPPPGTDWTKGTDGFLCPSGDPLPASGICPAAMCPDHVTYVGIDGLDGCPKCEVFQCDEYSAPGYDGQTCLSGHMFVDLTGQKCVSTRY